MEKSDVSEGKIDHLIDLLESDDFHGMDKSLKLSLFEYGFVFKYASMGSYVLIIKVPENFPGGPGYKIEALDKYDILDPRNTHIPLPDGCEKLIDMAGMNDAPLLHHTIQNGDFYYPAHYFDKPKSIDKLIEMLEDIVNNN